MSGIPSAIAAAILGAVMLAGCGREPLSGPPELRLGRDECAECGMIINEDRCSSALLIEREGMREHIAFDDIGCMLDYEFENKGDLMIVQGFVHDHSTQAWVETNAASYLFADRERIPTPMGSGIVAFANQEGAEAAQAEFGGKLLGYAQLASARRAWVEALYGKPRSAP